MKEHDANIRHQTNKNSTEPPRWMLKSGEVPRHYFLNKCHEDFFLERLFAYLPKSFSVMKVATVREVSAVVVPGATNELLLGMGALSV